MRKIVLVFVFMLFLGTPLFCQTSQKNFPVLKGQYLGQEPPGITPEIFAPGIISTDQFEFGGTFSPDGTEFFFTRRSDYDGSDNRIYYTRKVNGSWTKPALATFATENFEFLPVITPDGDKLFFYSERPRPDTKGFNGDLWYCLREDQEWSEAKFFESPINKKYTMMLTSTKDGTLYFSGNYDGKRGGFKSINSDGRYQNFEYLPQEINTIRPAHPFIAPDESYLIFDAQVKGMGKPELFICFRKPDGSWSQPQNMGPEINATQTEFAANVSPDGKYLFFHRRVNKNGEIYWVSSKIIEELKPKELK
ncbi:MAG: hypothetical protein KKG99_13045 [Bacteroidetes bacterium]|nr:hypothetical protein [Bacteroidota bacterium]